MTEKQQPKEGDKKVCFQCKSEMVYGWSQGSENYPSKLQWQTDGKAHYGFNRETQKPFCKKNQPIVEKAEKAGEASQSRGEIHLKDLKSLSKEMVMQIGEETQTMLEVQLCRIFFIEDGLKKAGINPSGPFVGMLYNQQMESLRNVSA